MVERIVWDVLIKKGTEVVRVVGGGKRNHHPSFLVVGCVEQAEDTS